MSLMVLSVFCILGAAVEYGILCTRGKWKLLAIAPPLFLAASWLSLWQQSGAALETDSLAQGVGVIVVILPGLLGILLALLGWTVLQLRQRKLIRPTE